MLLPLFGVVGLFELLFPKRATKYAVGLLFESSEGIELKSWVTTAARIEGLILLLLVLRRRGN